MVDVMESMVLVFLFIYYDKVWGYIQYQTLKKVAGFGGEIVYLKKNIYIYNVYYNVEDNSIYSQANFML